MNISFSVLSPPVIGQASQTPSLRPGAESQSWLVLQAAGGFIFPATHAIGLHLIGEFGGMCEARVTSVGSGDTPSAATPSLYSAQYCRFLPGLNTSGGSKVF